MQVLSFHNLSVLPVLRDCQPHVLPLDDDPKLNLDSVEPWRIELHHDRDNCAHLSSNREAPRAVSAY